MITLPLRFDALESFGPIGFKDFTFSKRHWLKRLERMAQSFGDGRFLACVPQLCILHVAGILPMLLREVLLFRFRNVPVNNILNLTW